MPDPTMTTSYSASIVASTLWSSHPLGLVRPIAGALVREPDRMRLDQGPDRSQLVITAVEQRRLGVVLRLELREVPDVHDLLGDDHGVVEVLLVAQTGGQLVVDRRFGILRSKGL